MQIVLKCAFRLKKDKNTSPLFVKLVSDILLTMRSYDENDETQNLFDSLTSPVECIKRIFGQLKDNNGE